MDDSDPFSFDDPITYAVKTGDISKGASPNDASLAGIDDTTEPAFAEGDGRLSTSEAVLGLVLALAFVFVAVLSL